jgi:hypothetical protein
MQEMQWTKNALNWTERSYSCKVVFLEAMLDLCHLENIINSVLLSKFPRKSRTSLSGARPTILKPLV